MAEEKEGEKSSWNFSADHSKLVFSMLNKSQICYSKGDVGNWFENLRGIHELMNYNLKKTTVVEIDKDIAYITRRQRFWNKHRDIKEMGLDIKLTRQEEIYRRQFIEGIRKLQRKMMHVLKAAGYLTNKVDETNVDM